MLVSTYNGDAVHKLLADKTLMRIKTMQSSIKFYFNNFLADENYHKKIAELIRQDEYLHNYMEDELEVIELELNHNLLYNCTCCDKLRVLECLKITSTYAPNMLDEMKKMLVRKKRV